MNPSNPLTARRLKLIEAAIKEQGMTYKEIADATFASPAYILRLMRDLRLAGYVHIAGWKLCTNNHAALYVWGPGRNARRPKPMTGTEGQRAYRERIRKDPERNEFFLAKMRAKDRARAASKRPQTPFSALFMGGAHA